MAAPTTALACPRDGSALAPFALDTITVDRCRACLGVWLDATELRRVTHDDELEALATDARAAAPESGFACPRCGGACRQTAVADVLLDTCLSCRGVWLDRGELHDARTRLTVERVVARRGGLPRWLARLME